MRQVVADLDRRSLQRGETGRAVVFLRARSQGARHDTAGILQVVGRNAARGAD